MCYDFFMSIITGLICSALIFVLSVFYSVNAKNKTIANLKLLDVYLKSISNDLVWGTEDLKEDYYDNIIVKINFILLYINEINDVVKPLNFVFHKRKYILFQIDEIERFINKCFTNVICTKTDDEKISRMNELKNEFSAEVDFILLHRIDFALILLRNITNVDDAIKKCSTGCGENDYLIIEKELKRIK